MKKLFTLLTISSILLSCGTDDEMPDAACDNGIFVGNVVLRTQQEVDDFGAECYTRIDGALNIGIPSEDGNNISDLSALSNLTEIISNNQDNGIATLGIYSTELVDLSGLQNLTRVGRLSITNNANLTSLNGLNSLQVVNMDFNIIHGLTIEGNNSLLSLDGLNGLQRIGNSPISTELMALRIYSNSELENVDALEQLIEAYGQIQFWTGCGISDQEICYNPSLLDFCGLQNLFTNGIYGHIYLNSINPFVSVFNPTAQDIIDGNCSQ